MEAIEKIKEIVALAVPAAKIEIINSTPAAQQPALLVDREHIYGVGKFFKEDPRFQMDFCSCVTAVDYPAKADKPGCIEVVYHLYSVEQKQGPIVLKVRAPRELDQCRVPSLTPLWRACEFQEREAYDLYGVKFDGHPDLRRILMWDEFTDFPMRKDYVPPADYEWEPTPHDDTLQRAVQEGGIMPPTAVEELGESEEEMIQPLADLKPYTLTPGSDGIIETQTLEVSIGPQHPSTHGVFRMDCVLDGESVVALKPVMGYLHRNHEQLAERMAWLGSMPYTDRLDYFNSMTNNWAYALAVEKLAGIKVPDRAEYIRVIMAELTRLLNHSCVIGFMLQDLGAWGTPLLYAFRERERILDLFEAVSGSRMMCNYMRFGGVRVNLTDENVATAKDIATRFPRFLDEFEKLLTNNEVLLARTQRVGVLPKELAINAGISGPMARASGVDYDLRKVDKYGVYSRLDFRVPLGDIGDVYDRYYIRVLEMRESIKILQQALRDIPQGPFIAPEVKLRNFKIPPGDGYGRVEGPKGELGFYLVSDEGGKQPYRYHVRPPSFVNLTVLEDMCVGHKVADVVVILGSVDIVLGEVDR